MPAVFASAEVHRNVVPFFVRRLVRPRYRAHEHRGLVVFGEAVRRHRDLRCVVHRKNIWPIRVLTFQAVFSLCHR